jgi:hypothetical protein
MTTVEIQFDEERKSPDYLRRARVLGVDFGGLVGERIIGIRPLTRVEVEMMGWTYDNGSIPFVIVTTNGSFIPMSDPEGNSAGYGIIA